MEAGLVERKLGKFCTAASSMLLAWSLYSRLGLARDLPGIQVSIYRRSRIPAECLLRCLKHWVYNYNLCLRKLDRCHRGSHLDIVQDNQGWRLDVATTLRTPVGVWNGNERQWLRKVYLC